MKLKLRNGLDLKLEGGPEQRLQGSRPVSSVAVLGSDYRGLRPELRVAQGDRVRAGQTLFVDRQRPEICITAPAAGIVEDVRLGHRRTLDKVVIRIDADASETFERPEGRASRGALQDLLLVSGCWTALRTRPFGRIPDPDAVPAAIFVTAIETDPLAADAAVILTPAMQQLERGLEALKLLTDGPVYLCQAPGPALMSENDRLIVTTFDGPHPSGLPGTHIHHLMPVSANRVVWHIGAQDVVAIGHLLETGRIQTERTIALAGPGVRHRGLFTTRLGANLHDLVQGDTLQEAVRLVSGSLLSGREAAWLGRYHTQVTVLPKGKSAQPTSVFQGLLGWLSSRGVQGPTIPLESFERAMPLDILPVPLMRALAIGDVETAERLGCLELVEEDVALLSHLCPSASDYGVLLRRALDELEGARA